MAELFKIGDVEHSLWLSALPAHGFCLNWKDSRTDIELHSVQGSRHQFRIGGETCEAVIATVGDRLHIHLDGDIYEVDYIDPVSRYAKAFDEVAGNNVRAPMPGTVVSCAVRAGDAVETGDVLVVIESMKLETSIKAWRSATVEALHVDAGEAFERDALLVTLAPSRKA
jgi:3-methylcrotonyl-CoA carboxylase alpha subunit